MTKAIVFAIVASLSLVSMAMLSPMVVMQQTADAAHQPPIYPGFGQTFQECRQIWMDTLDETPRNATSACLRATGH
jgi:hypothetical protein